MSAIPSIGGAPQVPPSEKEEKKRPLPNTLILSSIPSEGSPPEEETFDQELIIRSYTVTFRGFSYKLRVRKSIAKSWNELTPDEQTQVNADMEALKTRLIDDLKKSQMGAKSTIRFHFTKNEGYLAYAPKEGVELDQLENIWKNDEELKKNCDHYYRSDLETGKRIANTFLAEELSEMHTQIQTWDQPSGPVETKDPESAPEPAAPQEKPADLPSAPSAPPIEHQWGKESQLLIEFGPKESGTGTASSFNDLYEEGMAQFRGGKERIDLRGAEITDSEKAIETIQKLLAELYTDSDGRLILWLPDTLAPHAERLKNWVVNSLTPRQPIEPEEAKPNRTNKVRAEQQFGDWKSSFRVVGFPERLPPKKDPTQPASEEAIAKLKQTFNQQLDNGNETVVALYQGEKPETPAFKKVNAYCDIDAFGCSYEEALDAFLDVLKNKGTRFNQTIRLLCPDSIITEKMNSIQQTIKTLRIDAGQKVRNERKGADVDKEPLGESNEIPGRMKLTIFRAKAPKPKKELTVEEIKGELNGAVQEKREAEIVLGENQTNPFGKLEQALREFYQDHRKEPLKIALFTDQTLSRKQIERNLLLQFFNDEIAAHDFEPGTEGEGKIRFQQKGLVIVGAKNESRPDQGRTTLQYGPGFLKSFVKKRVNELQKQDTILDFRNGVHEYFTQTDNSEKYSFDLREFDEKDPYQEIISALQSYPFPEGKTLTVLLPNKWAQRGVQEGAFPSAPPLRARAAQGLQALWNAFPFRQKQ